jgi:hypothetical protein
MSEPRLFTDRANGVAEINSQSGQVSAPRKNWQAPLVILSTIDEDTANDKGFNFTPDHFIPSFGTFAS